MAIDVYVMPLWRFLAGDFESPLARFSRETGIPAAVIYLQQLRSPQKFFQRFRAKRSVKFLQSLVSKQLGKPCEWVDEGLTYYGHQFHSHQSLQAFARWVDLQSEIPDFDSSPFKQRGSTHPCFKIAKASWTFNQIVGLNFYSCYLLPLEFDDVVKVTGSNWSTSFSELQVRSSHSLLRELEGLNQHLKVPEGWDHKTWPEHRFGPMSALYQLREVLRLSITHGVPVIFYG